MKATTTNTVRIEMTEEEAAKILQFLDDALWAYGATGGEETTSVLAGEALFHELEQIGAGED